MAAISCGTPNVRCLDSAEGVSSGALMTVVVVAMVCKLVESWIAARNGHAVDLSSIEALLLAHRESMHQRSVMINAMPGFEDCKLM
jgi:hypothetical protein